MASPSSGAPPEQEAVTTQEKLIEEKEERLQRLLDMNRAKLASMEADLLVLRRDMKLTSQPKKAALEMLRLRIEEASERVRTARSTRNAAAAALAAAESRLAAEEAGKQQLVRDMHMLIHQSTEDQMKALEALQSRMDSLVAQVHTGGAPEAAAPAEGSAPASSDAIRAARAELEAAAVVNAVDEARQRHVALPQPGAASGHAARPPHPAEQRASGGRPHTTAALAVPAQPRALTGSSGTFSGFSV